MLQPQKLLPIKIERADRRGSTWSDFSHRTRAQVSETYSCAGLLNCRNDLQSDPSAVDLQKFLSAKKNLFFCTPSLFRSMREIIGENMKFVLVEFF